MTILFCFDCDNTLDVSQGPVPVSLLYKLMSEGFLVYIVSPSPFCTRLDIPHFTLLGGRWCTLKKLKSRVKADRYIYVGDTYADYEAAKIAGYEFVYAKDFKNWIGY